MNILDEIAARTRNRIDERKKIHSFAQVRRQAESIEVGDFPFEKSLGSSDLGFICEIKKASPSKGIIAEDFPYLQIARDYESAGAAAISVLTEPFYFKGSDDYLCEIADTVATPLLRKDFTVDEYMIYEAKILGADAILLICAILEKSALAEYIEIAHDIGLSVLVETHDESEVEMALSANSRVIGVNNRNLKTFEVDVSLSGRLRRLVPSDRLFVAESGINSPADINILREAGVNAVLIGETLMRSHDKKAEIEKLRGTGTKT